MTCQSIQEKMHDYLDGVLPEELCADFEAHLGNCPECAKEVEALREVLQLLKEMPIEHLPEDFEATLHEALVRESETIKNRQVDTTFKVRFKKWQKGLTYAAAVFLVGVVGLSGLNSMPSLLATKSAAPEMARSEAPANEKLGIQFNESVMDNVEEAAPGAVGANMAFAPAEVEATSVEVTSVESDPFTPEAIKRIKTAQITLEIKAYTETFERIGALVTNLGGYVENAQTGTYTEYVGGQSILLHEGYMVLRLPQENFEAVLNSVGEEGTVVSSAEQVEDITSFYRDTYQELKNLEVREASLRDIMAKASNVTEIIEVERELSRVRQEINRYGTQLNAWDRQVALSTIHVSLREVRDTTTVVNPPQKNLFESAKAAFVNTINQMIEWFEKLFIAFVGALPVLLPLTILGAVVWMGYKRRKKA